MITGPKIEVVTNNQCDQKKIEKMRDHFLKMRHKMSAYLIQLLNKQSSKN